MNTHTTGASPRRFSTTLFAIAGVLMLISPGPAPVTAQQTPAREAPATQNGQEIDLETAVAMALQNNLGIEDEMLNLMQKKLIADTWWNRFYPSLNARATMRRANETQETSGIVPVGPQTAPGSGVYGQVAQFSQEAPQWGLSTALEARLDLTLQMVPGIRLAALDYESGKITMSRARREVERDVAKQFYQLLLLKEQIGLSRQQIDTAERRYNQARTNYENGLADEYAMLSARVAWENQKPQLTGLQVQYQQALLSFRNSLGVELTRNVEPAGRISPPS
ncbi:MAG: TolC family protein, partial [Spirochaeta sp.]|nr:TolC family protein [Spirochaeta sp.]